MDLCLSILPAPQQTIFPELRDTPSHFVLYGGTAIALIDLAGMKMAVIQKRATLKDYIDIEAIITQTPIDLITALAAGRIIYGQQFNPYISLKALTYFEGGDLKALSPTLKKNLIGAAKAVQIEQIETRMEALKKLRNRTAAC